MNVETVLSGPDLAAIEKALFHPEAPDGSWLTFKLEGGPIKMMLQGVVRQGNGLWTVLATTTTGMNYKILYHPAGKNGFASLMKEPFI